MAPKLNIYLKIHKVNEPIRPVINNMQAPSYKAAKYLNKKLCNLICLPHTHNIKNSQELAEELVNFHTDKDKRLITYDIKDLFVNLPTQGIIKTTKFWLKRNNIDNEIINQTIQMLTTIIKQNYFQYNNQWFQPEKGVAMGSPISSTIAEIYLQYMEQIYIKHWLESKEITYYRRYVDDILIIYNIDNTNEQKISHYINNIDKNLQFKPTNEENNTISYLDLSVYRNNNNLDLSIYRKPTSTDTCIHYLSNHPHEQKTAAFKLQIRFFKGSMWLKIVMPY